MVSSVLDAAFKDRGRRDVQHALARDRMSSTLFPGQRGRHEDVSASRRMAAALVGAWRASPPPLASADGLLATVPLLCQTGAAGLAWWRLRGTPAEACRAARPLRQAFRLFTLEAVA